jgi:5'-3' exonuclease
MDVMTEIQDLCRYCGIVTLKKEGLEADDLIAMVCRTVGSNIAIVTGDKDMLQLVSDESNIFVVRPGKGGEVKILKEKDVKDVFGVAVSDLKYYLALSGDSVDEIKGVPGYGKAKARGALQYWHKKKQILSGLSVPDRKTFLLNLKLVKLTNLPFHLDRSCLYSFKKPNGIALTNMLHEFQIRKFTFFELIQKFYNPKFKINFLRKVVKDRK